MPNEKDQAVATLPRLARATAVVATGRATTVYLNDPVWQEFKQVCNNHGKSGSSRLQELIERDLIMMKQPPVAAKMFWQEVQRLIGDDKIDILKGNDKVKPKEQITEVINKEIAKLMENPDAYTNTTVTVNIKDLEARYRSLKKVVLDIRTMMKKEEVFNDMDDLADSLGLKADFSNADEIAAQINDLNDRRDGMELIVQFLTNRKAQVDLELQLRKARKTAHDFSSGVPKRVTKKVANQDTAAEP